VTATRVLVLRPFQSLTSMKTQSDIKENRTFFIMKIKSNTTNNDFPWRFGLYQRPSSEENVLPT